MARVLQKQNYLNWKKWLRLAVLPAIAVVNIGALKDKNYALVTDEIKNFVEICGKDCIQN